MKKETETLVHNILFALSDIGGEIIRSLPLPFETPYEHIRRVRNVYPKSYSDTVYNLQRQGLLKVTKKKNQRFLKLTRKGELEILVAKAKLDTTGGWDGRWRVFIWDIPEDSREKRDLLRSLLKREGFHKLQASVFISPYPLNNEAIRYLEETKLIEFVRIMRVDKMDNDKDLKKRFNLP